MSLSQQPRQLLLAVVSALLLGAVLLLPEVNNHTETEDAYMYASATRDTTVWSTLVHPNHRLYHLIGWGVYQVTGGDALSVLITISQVCAVAALLLCYFTLKNMGLDRSRAFLFTAILGVSYNYWRYTHAAEINAMAWLMQFSALYCVSKPDQRSLGWAIFAGVLTCLGTLVHTACAVAILPLTLSFYALSRQYKKGLAFGLSFIMLTVPLAWSLDHARTQKAPSADALAITPGVIDAGAPEGKRMKESAQNLSLKSIPKSFIALGSSFLAVNMVMGIEPIYAFFSEGMFKDRYLFEEYALAQGRPLWSQLLWGGLLLSALLYLVVKAFSSRGVAALRSFLPASPIVYACLIGGLGAYLFLLWFEPGNPEMWTLFLPVIALAAVVVFKSATPRTLIPFALLLGSLNFIGGISMLSEKKNDYFYTTVGGLLESAKEGDVLIKAQRHSGIPRYAHYHFPGVLTGTLPLDEHTNARGAKIQQYLKEGRRVFIHQEVMQREQGLGFNLAPLAMQYVPLPSGGGYLVSAD